MLNNIICAGVGGQGALTLGMLLAEASAMQGKNVTYVPEYGSQMRGGNASVKIKVSDEPIVNPFMEKVNILVALHTLPIPMYIDLVQEGATVIAESELVHEIELPAKVKLVHIPANEIAEKMGNPRGMSAVMAGAVVALADLFPYEDGVKAVSQYYEEKHIPVEINRDAFIEGYNYIKNKK